MFFFRGVNVKIATFPLDYQSEINNLDRIPQSQVKSLDHSTTLFFVAGGVCCTLFSTHYIIIGIIVCISYVNSDVHTMLDCVLVSRLSSQHAMK